MPESLPMMSIKQVSDELKVSPSRVRQLIADGRIDAQKVGPNWVVTNIERARVRPAARGVTSGAGVIQSARRRNERVAVLERKWGVNSAKAQRVREVTCKKALRLKRVYDRRVLDAGGVHKAFQYGEWVFCGFLGRRDRALVEQQQFEETRARFLKDTAQRYLTRQELLQRAQAVLGEA